MLVYIFLTDMLETGVTYTTRVSSVLWFYMCWCMAWKTV